MDRLWGCQGWGEVPWPKPRFGDEDSEACLGHIECEDSGTHLGGQGDSLSSYLNCSYNNEPATSDSVR